MVIEADGPSGRWEQVLAEHASHKARAGSSGFFSDRNRQHGCVESTDWRCKTYVRTELLPVVLLLSQRRLPACLPPQLVGYQGYSWRERARLRLYLETWCF